MMNRMVETGLDRGTRLDRGTYLLPSSQSQKGQPDELAIGRLQFVFIALSQIMGRRVERRKLMP